MIAIVEIAGKQFKVSENERVKIPLIKQEEGSTVEFDHVLYLEKDGNVSVGTPAIQGAKVSATVVRHDRDKKVLVFKKKRRKQYKKLQGHRQNFTVIQVNSIA